MEKYILTSPSFKGSVVFGFVGAFLMYYHNESEMTEPQIMWLLKNLPIDKAKLEQVKAVIKGKLELIPPDLSFDAFWETYGKKVNRKRCEPLWAKMSEPDRITCLISIKPYDGYLKRSGGRAKLDPENYLKKGSYLNNWNQLQG